MATSALKLIKDYFFPKNMSTKEILEEIKQLTDQDKKDLAQGLSDGTLTY